MGQGGGGGRGGVHWHEPERRERRERGRGRSLGIVSLGSDFLQPPTPHPRLYTRRRTGRSLTGAGEGGEEGREVEGELVTVGSRKTLLTQLECIRRATVIVRWY